MIDRGDVLPVVKQCELLDVARLTFCYQPAPRSSDTDLMRRIDEIHLRYPFLGSGVSSMSLPIRASSSTVSMCNG